MTGENYPPISIAQLINLLRFVRKNKNCYGLGNITHRISPLVQRKRCILNTLLTNPVPSHIFRLLHNFKWGETGNNPRHSSLFQKLWTFREESAARYETIPMFYNTVGEWLSEVNHGACFGFHLRFLRWDGFLSEVVYTKAVVEDIAIKSTARACSAPLIVLWSSPELDEIRPVTLLWG